MNDFRGVPRAVSSHVRSTLYGVLASAALSLTSGNAQAAPSIADAPSAVSSAQQYVAANGGKAGFKVLGGVLLGGGGPIAWSLIEIYASGTHGYGKATLVGLGYSDGSGDIHAAFSATSSQELYLVALGGFAGDDTYNTAIGLSAPLGTSATIPATVTVDEATTVGAVYALAQFLDSTGQQPGSSATNAMGLSNAVAVFADLVDLSTGDAATSLVSGASGSPPTATINTLANILSPCITSGGASSTQCTELFAAATPAGGTAPSNTLEAALSIARNEGSNVASLFALAGSGPFTPALTVVPNDWSVGISYTGGALGSSPFVLGVAIDSAGNAWVADALSDSSANNGAGLVLWLSPQGVQKGSFVDGGNVDVPGSVAIDPAGNIWIANARSASSVGNGNGSVSGLDSAGTSLPGSPFGIGAVINPEQVVTDGSGNVWVLSTEQTFVTKLAAASSYSATKYTVTDGGQYAPFLAALAVDNAGNVWLSDGNNELLVGLSGSDPNQPLPGSPFSGGGFYDSVSLTVDPTGNVWSANSGGNGVTKFVAPGYSAVQFLSNDVLRPSASAGDGAGNIWVANHDNSGRTGVVPLSGSGAPLAGSAGILTAGGASTRSPGSVAIDASGNVWLASGNVVELVGAATPVKTPLVGQPTLP